MLPSKNQVSRCGLGMCLLFLLERTREVGRHFPVSLNRFIGMELKKKYHQPLEPSRLLLLGTLAAEGQLGVALLSVVGRNLGPSGTGPSHTGPSRTGLSHTGPNGQGAENTARNGAFVSMSLGHHPRHCRRGHACSGQGRSRR